MLVFLLLSKRASASIIISEVHPAPSTGSEWIEVYNMGTEVVSLLDWKFFDLYTTPALIYSFDEVIIAPNSFFTATLASNKLNNSGDGVRLFDENGALIDEMLYSYSQPDFSWGRLFLDISASFTLTNPTKNAPNIPATPSPTPTPTPTPTTLPSSSPSPSPTPSPANTAITISEVMACPNQNEQEWIELFNPSNDPVTLESWRLYDAANNSRSIAGTVLAQNYLVISWESGMLNNAGDSIFLKNELGLTIQSIEYQDCETGLSLIAANLNSGTDWMPSTPTPGFKNSEPAVASREAADSNSTDTQSQTTAPNNEQNSPNSAGSVEPASKLPWQGLRLPQIFTNTASNSAKNILSTSSPAAADSDRLSSIPPNTYSSKHSVLSAILGGLLLIGSGTSFIFSSWQALLFGERF